MYQHEAFLFHFKVHNLIKNPLEFLLTLEESAKRFRLHQDTNDSC